MLPRHPLARMCICAESCRTLLEFFKECGVHTKNRRPMQSLNPWAETRQKHKRLVIEVAQNMLRGQNGGEGAEVKLSVKIQTDAKRNNGGGGGGGVKPCVTIAEMNSKKGKFLGGFSASKC